MELASTLSPADAELSAPLLVDVVSDVVCPWCYIGKRKLEAALGELQAREPGLDARVRWHPFQLNPGPASRRHAAREYLEAKFGGAARAAEIYARVRAVGAEVGIAFDFERIALQPNTLDAHRLIAWAQQRGDAARRAGRALSSAPISSRAASSATARSWRRRRRGRAARRRGTGHARLRRHAAEVEAEDREAREVGHRRRAVFHFQRPHRGVGAHDPPALLDAIAARAGSVMTR